jgi:CRP-like cAMP-binding protein
MTQNREWTQPYPNDNQLLYRLPDAEAQMLRAGLEPVQLSTGTTLYEAGTALRHVYFPTTAVVSLTATLRRGASAEVAMVGREGIVGVCGFMGQGRSLSGAVVQAAGHAWRMPAVTIHQAAQQSSALMRLLLAYTQALFAHMAQTSACSRHHSIDQQLCRWLLLHADRQDSPTLAVTQERIAQMLGVRREGVTVCALRLQQAGLIRYARGRITVLDRAGLEARSCECYGVVREAYDRLGTAPHAGASAEAATASAAHSHADHSPWLTKCAPRATCASA